MCSVYLISVVAICRLVVKVCISYTVFIRALSQSTDLTKDIPEWVCNCDSPTIEPDTKSVITTIESELSNDDEEDQKHCLGDGHLDKLEPCNMQGAQVANKDYVCSHTALSPNKSACTSSSACTNSSSGISERYIRIYSREPSLTNFGNGEWLVYSDMANLSLVATT